MISKDYRNHGTCAAYTHLRIDEEGVIREASIEGGCSGNTQGLCRLLLGRKARDAAELLRGVRCGSKPTSCPDQLAMALEEVIQEHPELPAT